MGKDFMGRTFFQANKIPFWKTKFIIYIDIDIEIYCKDIINF